MYRTIAVVLSIMMFDSGSVTLFARSNDASTEQSAPAPECTIAEPCPMNVKGAAILIGILGSLTWWAFWKTGRDAAKNFVAPPVPSWREVEPGIVHITYDLVSTQHRELRVTVEALNDLKPIAMRSVRGDVGLVRTGYGKAIVWDAAADFADEEFTSLRFTIKARKP